MGTRLSVVRVTIPGIRGIRRARVELLRAVLTMLTIASIWAVVLGGAALKVRAERLQSIDAFQRQLRAFAGLPSLDDTPARAEAHSPLDGRRLGPPVGAAGLLRRILGALLATVALSFLYALATGTRVAWGLTLLMVDALLAYIALLVHRRDRLAEARAAQESGIPGAPPLVARRSRRSSRIVLDGRGSVPPRVPAIT